MSNKENSVPANRLTLTPSGSQGAGLTRPECALTHSSGLVFAPCWQGNGGVSLMLGDQTHHRLTNTRPEPLAGEALRPNGIALSSSGELLMAHLGETRGAIVALTADGSARIAVDSADGQPLPPANFVTSDRAGRLWITVSTRLTPRARDYRKGACSGFIAVAEPGERNARIVADGLGYTNECVLDEEAGYLYVNETFARRLTRFALTASGELGDAQVLVEFGEGCYPDGLAADDDGGLWVTSIVSNRVLHVAASGHVSVVLEDSDPAHVAWAEAAWETDTLDRAHLDKAGTGSLRNISNLAFGGADLQSVWLGNLLGDCLPVFRAGVRGCEPVHWHAPVGDWLSLFDAHSN